MNNQAVWHIVKDPDWDQGLLGFDLASKPTWPKLV